jgi:hypothetical protein
LVFVIRDNSVHHFEIWEQMVVVEETEETIIHGGRPILISPQPALPALTRSHATSSIASFKIQSRSTEAWASRIRSEAGN